MNIQEKLTSDTSPGQVIHDLSFSDYQAISRVNWSTAKDATNPDKLLKKLSGESDRKIPAYKNLNHDQTLDPNFRAEDWYVFPEGFDLKSEARRKEWAEKEAEFKGKVVKYADWHETLARKERLISSTMWSVIWNGRAATELTVTGFCPHTPLPVKGRFDLIMKDEWGILWDLKLLQSIEEHSVIKAIEHWGYDGQLAWYQELANQHGMNVRQVGLIVQQDAAPYDVEYYILPERILERGREKVERCMRTLQLCLKHGMWPRTDGQQIKKLSVPRWMERE